MFHLSLTSSLYSLNRYCSLISASTDGRICIWDLDQLQAPVHKFDLRITISITSSINHLSDKKIEASITSFVVPSTEGKEWIFGTETGRLYASTLDIAPKSKADVNMEDPATNALAKEVVLSLFSKDHTHYGPVTSMHLHPLLPNHHDGLLLTSSLDSTVKLWNIEHSTVPMYTFEPSTDYIGDVRWSPIRVCVFAVVDGNGTVTFWNLVKDTEVPVLEIKISERALNKIRWSMDGKSVMIGDAVGQTIVYEVPHEVRTLSSCV